MASSQNGYRANARWLTSYKQIPGTQRWLRLRRGNPGWMLRDFAAWFDKHIETIDHDGQLDDWGYAERPIRGSTTTLSNHASGTAMDLNAPEHPLGVRHTFTANQARAIRSKLLEYEGCIRWGGSYEGRPDEMHFELNRSLPVVRRVARQIRRERKQEADPMAKYSEKELRKMFREEAEAALENILGVDVNKHDPKGTEEFRGMTLRELLKRVARATGAVKQ